MGTPKNGYRIGDVAKQFGVSHYTVAQWMKQLDLPHVHLSGGQRRIPEYSYVAILNAVQDHVVSKPIHKYTPPKSAKLDVSVLCRNQPFNLYQGLTYDDLLIIMKQQRGACAICHEPFMMYDYFRPSRYPRDRKQDILGLLCRYCMQGLQGFRDNHERCRAATEFLLKRDISSDNPHHPETPQDKLT